jgi:pyridinium-3,5-bisthiocarboxylic acid mononucleotide nickel chelatase
MIYVDCSSGISGDMFASALVGLGADEKRIRKVLRPIAKVGFRRTVKKGVPAFRLDVEFDPKTREYLNLVKSIKRLKLRPKTEGFALRVLKILAQAESEVHDVPLGKVHLHEAADCVVDAIACAVALEDLGLLKETFQSSILSCGLLAPATMRIIEEYGVPVKFVSEREILTPTGAALIAALSCEYGNMEYSDAGIGAGSMNLPWPNILRVAVVRPKVVLESNIDDCTPEHISHMMSALMDDGALDVHVIPCAMKKGRLGFLARVLTERPNEHASVIMAETGTLGVRVIPLESRFELPRRMETVTVKVGASSERIRVKFSPIGYKPEFDDVSKAARKHGLSFRQVREAVSARLCEK